MTTEFSTLPLVDLSPLSSDFPSQDDLFSLSKELYSIFATTGFAYLTNVPLSFSHEEVFKLGADFFSMSQAEKMQLAKKTFAKANKNTYRGYFPTQPGQQDNLKEGFEIGSSTTRRSPLAAKQKFDLAEPNVWPAESSFETGRARLEKLYSELQTLSSTLLSLVAVSLDKPADYFSSYVTDSLSTLRLLHYPPQTSSPKDEIKLCCTPHTDSGIMTLLHQDPTGGLEVLNAAGDWIPAPYIHNSIVVNIGDLLAQVSGGRFIATMHRVRTSSSSESADRGSNGLGRLSVPFFFEPGEACIVRSVDGGEGVIYGEHMRRKMGTWVEYQDEPEGQVESSVQLALVSAEA